MTEFFKAYFPIVNASVGNQHDKIYYIDLFSGQGYYNDGTPSTPIVLLDLVSQFKSEDIRRKLQVVLNDNTASTYEKLCDAVNKHEVISKLTFKPLVLNKKASEVPIDKYISGNKPCFSFVDPFGYIDVSADQIWTLVRNLGSDCVLFFNANRILQDLGKQSQEIYFSDIFGSELQTAKKIHQDTIISQQTKCEGFLKCFSKNLYETMNRDKSTKYKLFLLPFRFESDDRVTTSHYILFISKSHKAIQEMKKVMLKFSTNTGENLSFDSKVQYQISFMHREDNLSESIIEEIKKMIHMRQGIINESLTVTGLMEKLDSYSMLTQSHVLPYSLSEIQTAVEVLDKKGLVDITAVPNMKKRITQTREFRFSKNLLVD